MTHETITFIPDTAQLTEGRATWGMIAESLAHTAALLVKASCTDSDTLFGRPLAPSGDGPRTDDHAQAALKVVRAACWLVSARLADSHAKSAEYAAHACDQALAASREASHLSEDHRQAVADEAHQRAERFCWVDAKGDLQAGTIADYAREWKYGYGQAATPARRVMSASGNRWPVTVEQQVQNGVLAGWRLAVLGQETVVLAQGEGEDHD